MSLLTLMYCTMHTHSQAILCWVHRNLGIVTWIFFFHLTDNKYSVNSLELQLESFSDVETLLPIMDKNIERKYSWTLKCCQLHVVWNSCLVWSLFCVKIAILNVTCKQQCDLLTSVFNVKICANFDAMWPPNMNVTCKHKLWMRFEQFLVWSSLQTLMQISKFWMHT